MNERTADPLNLFPGQTREQKPDSHGFGATVGAAFRLENDMVNLAEMAARPEFEPDFTFDLMEIGPKSELWDRHSNDLAQARSEPEFRSLEARIRKREEDLSIISDQGFGGFAAAMLAGVTSPTMLIPLVGPARGAKGVAQAFGLAATAATAQEVPLLANQLGRGGLESTVAIAGGTVLGGLLGSGAMMLRRSDFDRAARDLSSDVEPAAYAQVRRTESGAVVREGEQVPLRMPEELGQRPNAPALRIGVDNPGGRWLEAKQARAEENMLQAETPTGLRGTGMSGSTTAYTKEPVMLPISMVRGLRGANGEMPAPGSPKYDSLRAQVDERGFDPLQRDGDTKNAVVIGVNHRGEAYILEGNNRTKIADEMGESTIRAEVRWWNGGETAETPWSAANVKKRFEEGTTPASAANDLDPPARTGSQAMGAARTGERFVSEGETAPDAGTIAPALGVGERLARTSPAARVVTQPGAPIVIQSLRDAGQRISDGGLSMSRNIEGVATAPGGTAESRQGWYQGLLGRALYTQYEAYLSYLKNGERVTRGDRFAAPINNLLNRAPEGKMSFAEFKAAVIDARHNPSAPHIKEVKEVATALRDNYFKPINETMLDATGQRGHKALYSILEETPDQGYFPEQLAPEKVARNREGFVKMVADHLQNKMAAYYAKRIEKLHKQLETTDALEQLQGLSREEAQVAIRDLTDSLKRLADPAEMDPRVDQIRALRDEARDLYETELDRLLEETPETLRGDPDTVRGLRANARVAVKEEYDALRTRAAELEAELPKPVSDAKAARAQLRAQLRAIQNTFGAFEKKRLDALQKMDANEEMNLRALSRIVNATQRFMAGMNKMDDARLDAELGKLLAASRKAADLAERGRVRIERLEDATGETAVRLQLERTRQAGRELASERKSAKAQGAIALDRDSVRAQVQAQLNEALENVNALNNKRAERNAKLRDDVNTKYAPERVQESIDARRKKSERAAEKLEDELTAARATGINVRTGAFDVSEAAREVAEDLADKIVGNFTRMGQLDALANLRGPMKHRVLDIPYDIKREFLELDSEKALGRYTQTMASDIEIYRALGSVNGRAKMEQIIEEGRLVRQKLLERTKDEKGREITPAMREKQLAAHDKALKDNFYALNAMLDRLRGLRGLPEDPASIPYRIGRVFMHWNVASMMGSAAVTSIPDAARSVMAYGVGHVFRSSWAPFIRGLVDEGQRSINAAAIREMKLMGIGIDVFTQARARGFMDIMADSPFQTRGEKILEGASLITPRVALFGQWTDMMKLMSGMSTMSRIVGGVERIAAGKGTPDDMKVLARMGIDEPLARRIWSELQTENGAYRHEDILVPNLESWGDKGASRAFQAAMTRESESMVITPGLERPLWMDGSMPGRIIGQFRSFTMAANTKITVSAMQSRNMAAAHMLQGVMFSLALGAVSYYIWAMSSGERAQKEMADAGWEVWMDQALYRSGLLGALSEVQSIGATVPGLSPYVNFDGAASAGRRPTSIMGAVLGPSFGKAQDIATLLSGIDDPTEATVRQARKLMLYQNVFYIRRALDEVQEGVANMFNLPERRSQ